MKCVTLCCLILAVIITTANAQALSDKQQALFKKYPKLLFFIERDYNKNIVLYRAVGDEKPTDVKSVWLMLEKGGGFEEVLRSEQQAYGHSVRNQKMTLNPVPGIPIELDYDEELKRPVAYISVDDRRIRLVRVFFKVKKFFGVPTGAEYFDLHGYDVRTKEPVRQRVNPK